MNMHCPRILVVDDHRDAADTTADLFRMNGRCEVRVAYNGKEAVGVARSYHPHVVIMDINMPVMGGYEAAGLLRAEQRTGARMLLVAMTGRTQADDRERALAAGFDHHFPKPLMDERLFDLVASFLAQTALPETSRADCMSAPSGQSDGEHGFDG